MFLACVIREKKVTDLKSLSYSIILQHVEGLSLKIISIKIIFHFI